MSETVLNLDDVQLFAITVGHADGIPAVEQDLTTGKYHVLVFTSQEAAKKYCYLRQPGQIDNIYAMEKKSVNDSTFHIGLIRVARRCLADYKHIEGVLFDHPGSINKEVRYASMASVANAAKRLVPKSQVGNDLLDYLMKADYEDNI